MRGEMEAIDCEWKENESYFDGVIIIAIMWILASPVQWSYSNTIEWY